MLAEANGKEMGSVIFGGKVEIRDWGRIESGLKRRESRMADRSGGQSWNAIGVVGAAALKILSGQSSSEALQSIDHEITVGSLCKGILPRKRL